MEMWIILRTAPYIWSSNMYGSRSQLPRGLKCGSAAVRLLGLWVRIPPAVWMSVSCECCVLSGRGLWVGKTTRPEESCRMWCVWVWSWILDEETLAHWGCCAKVNKKYVRVWTHTRQQALACTT